MVFCKSAKAFRYGGPALTRVIWPIALAAALAGCAAMEGVNVGAHIPIGGVGSVGANKTIGQGQAPARTQRKPAEKPAEKSDDPASEGDPAAEEG